MSDRTNTRAGPSSDSNDTQGPSSTLKKKILYPTNKTLGLENLSIRRKSSSSSSPRKERFSTDISDEPFPPPTSPLSLGFTSNGASVERARTLPKMTVRRTSSLEADLVLAPLPRDKLARMRRWILALAIVNFDLDLGPVVDVLYPEAVIDGPGRENIAFSSFPDSAIFESGSECHSFRIRDPTLSSAAASKASLLSAGDDESPFTTDGFIYGFALFHQRKDPSSRRGYLQRSVVILSQHPYPSLFTACLAELAPMYFARGAPALETACHNIANWPAPTPGLACELGFMGSVLSIELPLSTTYHQLSQRSSSTTSLLASSSEPIILASLPSDPSTHLPSPLDLFSALLPKLWSLWECLVLSEPIILFAKSPRDASLAIWWLVEFLKPLPVAGGAMDWRPYFHIHDVDFDRLLGPSAAQGFALGPGGNGTSTPNQGQAPRGVLLGVTNPFFETIVKRAGWPHVVSVGHVASSSSASPSSMDRFGETPNATVANGNGGGGTGNGRDLGGNGMMAALALDPMQEQGGSGDVAGGRRVASEGMRMSTSGKGVRRASAHLRRASASFMRSSSPSPSPQPQPHSSQPQPNRQAQPNHRTGAMDLGPAPGFHTKHQRYISKDREVLKVLEGAVGKGGEAEARAVHILRQHFSQRASEVLVPLNRYFTSLISSSSSSTSHPIYSTHATSPPQLPAFSPTAFLASLKSGGSPLPFRTRGKQKEFYERWLRSPAFGVWMRERDEEARRALGGGGR